MSRTIVVLALTVWGCGGAETREQADQNSARIGALEDGLAALEERVLTAEGGIQANATAVADVSAEVVQLGADLDQTELAVADLAVRVEGHDLAIAEASGAVAGLDARLFDPVYGELPLLTTALGDVQVGLANQQASIDANAASIASTASAVALLGTQVTALEGAVAAQGTQLVDLGAEVDLHRADLDAQAADLVDLENTVGFHDAAITGLQGSVTDLETDLADQAADIAANTANIEQNAVDIASNALAITSVRSELGALDGVVDAQATAIAAIQADYLTSSDLVPLQTQVNQNASDIAALDADLTGVSELLTYVTVDTATDTVTVSAADLVVDGRLFTNDITFRACGGVAYACTPKACLAECQANGERMATTDEVLAWASFGQQKCQWQWMLDRDNPSVPVRAFPMYFNRTTTGCGALNTGDVPRFGGGPAVGTSWDDPTLANCACKSS